MFFAPGHIFGGTEGVESRFHVLRSQTHFRRYQGRRVPFLYFIHPNSFSALPWASGPVFMFFALGLVFGGTVGVGSRFLVLRSRTHFRRYSGPRVLFSCFVLPDSFWAVLGASGPVFLFCAPGLVFGGSVGVGSRFSCFAPPYSFSVVLRVSGPVFMFCAPRLIIGGTEGVGCLFHVLRSQTRFRRYGGCSFPFSCFSLPDIFSAVPRASSLVFMFCAPGLIFDGTEGVVSRFYFLCTGPHFRRYRGRQIPFSCFLLPDSFSAVPWRRVPFSCFALPDLFSTVPWASGPVFMFCAPGLIFGGIEGLGSLFHVLRSRTRFGRY
jgi:hypothetical protein